MAALKPIYDCIMIEATGGKVRLVASDPECYVATQFDAAVTEEGRVVINADRLASVLKYTADGVDTDFAIEDGKLRISQGDGYKANIPTMGEDEIAKIGFTIDAAEIILDASPKIIAGIVRAAGIVDPEPRPDNKFGGVLLDFTEAGMWIFTYTQARYYLQLFDAVKGASGRFVLAPRGVPLLEAVSLNSATKIGIMVEKKKILIANDETFALVSCIEDQFPTEFVDKLGMKGFAEASFPKIVKGAAPVPRWKLLLQREDIIGALGQASSTLDREDHCVSLTIETKLSDTEYVVTMTGVNSQTSGKAEARIVAKAEAAPPGPIRIGMHYANVRDTVKSLNSDQIALHVVDGDSVFIMQEQGNPHFVAAFVPLRPDYA